MHTRARVCKQAMMAFLTNYSLKKLVQAESRSRMQAPHPIRSASDTRWSYGITPPPADPNHTNPWHGDSRTFKASERCSLSGSSARYTYSLV